MKTNLKAGDVVICINNTGQTNNLTVGKKYTVLDQISGTEGIKIISDKGEEGGYFTSRFKLETSSSPGDCFFLKGGGE